MEGMKGQEVWKAARATAAHALLLTFTIVLLLKLHPDSSSISWWFVFSPLWLFHAVVHRGTFSIPAPSEFDCLPWDPFHSVVGMPLLIAFELLLCVYLETSHVNQVAALKLEIVFVPVFLLETIIILDNLSALTRQEFGDDIEDQRGFCLLITVAMAGFLFATVFLVQMIIGNVNKVIYWEAYLYFSIGQIFIFPLFFSDVSMRKRRKARGGCSSTSALVPQVEEDENLVTGGYFVVVVLIQVFQILLCMYLQGTPASAKEMPIPIVFSPVLLLQGVGVLVSTFYLVERIVVLLLHSEAANGRYFRLCSRACNFLVSIGHGIRSLGWWSVNDGSREAEALRRHECELGSHPVVVKKMPKKDLVDEVFTLQAAIKEQIQLVRSSQQEYEQLQSERVLCTICCERNIGVVLQPSDPLQRV